MNLPRYFVVGSRPVKFVATQDGGMAILKYDWQTGEFVYGMEYLSKVYGRGDIDELSEKEFDEYVEKLRKER
jgi:hypothetical protein